MGSDCRSSLGMVGVGLCCRHGSRHRLTLLDRVENIVPDKAWKAWERQVAEKVGGQRRGPDTRGPSGGKTDIIHDAYAIECKLLSRPKYCELLDAVRQAECNADPGQEPVAIVKRKGDRWQDALVVVRFETWREWHIGNAVSSISYTDPAVRCVHCSPRIVGPIPEPEG